MKKPPPADRAALPYLAEDLIAAEVRARLIASADDYIAHFDGSGGWTLAERVTQFSLDNERRMRALAAGLGIPYPIPVEPDTYDRITAEIETRLRQSLAARADRLLADVKPLLDDLEATAAEIRRVEAQQDTLNAEMRRMMLEGKRRTKKRVATMMDLCLASETGSSQSRALNANWTHIFTALCAALCMDPAEVTEKMLALANNPAEPPAPEAER